MISLVIRLFDPTHVDNDRTRLMTGWWLVMGFAAVTLFLAGCVEQVDIHLFEKTAAPAVQKAPDGTPCVKWPSLADDARQWLDAQAGAPASLGGYFSEIAGLQNTIKECPK